MDEGLAQLIRDRADNACEYCHIPQSLYPAPFEIDHIVARQHEGLTTAGNLALSCIHCNSHKGPVGARSPDRAPVVDRRSPAFRGDLRSARSGWRPSVSGMARSGDRATTRVADQYFQALRAELQDALIEGIVMVERQEAMLL